ncbi:MAG: ExbD/TolR family protein [Desulfovibrio sp.]|jgi:biopolymer transport protein TolR|nr:ExbD/TolR family protein [Desulfovibrio sp.]
MGHACSPGEDFASEINVTPFVDVMLVLLIIFMVAAPMMVEGLGVELPKVKTAEALPTDRDHLILTLRGDGKLLLDESEIDAAALEEALRHLVALPRKQLFLRADKQVTHGAVMEVMGLIRAAGVDRIGMVAESASPAPAPADGLWSVPGGAPIPPVGKGE